MIYVKLLLHYSSLQLTLQRINTPSSLHIFIPNNLVFHLQKQSLKLIWVILTAWSNCFIRNILKKCNLNLMDSVVNFWPCVWENNICIILYKKTFTWKLIIDSSKNPYKIISYYYPFTQQYSASLIPSLDKVCLVILEGIQQQTGKSWSSSKMNYKKQMNNVTAWFCRKGSIVQ